MCRRRLRQAGWRQRIARDLSRAGWTSYTYALSGFLFILFTAATIVAINGNPTSQLSIICCAVWIVFIIAAGVALLDRRNR